MKKWGKVHLHVVTVRTLLLAPRPPELDVTTTQSYIVAGRRFLTTALLFVKEKLYCSAVNVEFISKKYCCAVCTESHSSPMAVLEIAFE